MSKFIEHICIISEIMSPLYKKERETKQGISYLKKLTKIRNHDTLLEMELKSEKEKLVNIQKEIQETENVLHNKEE